MTNNIYELMVRLPAIMKTALDCSARVVGLPTLERTAHDLQMVYYWWRDADAQLKKLQRDDKVLSEGSVVIPASGPVLLGLSEKIEYIDTELTKLAEETQRFMDEHTLPPKVQYRMEQGYNKVMEALYNNEISKVYLADAKKSK